jgi:hypothetical protein
VVTCTFQAQVNMLLPQNCDCGLPFISNRVIKAQKANGFVTRTSWGTHFIATANQRSMKEICFSSKTTHYNKQFIVKEANIDKKNPKVAIWEHRLRDPTTTSTADNWPLRSGKDSWQPAGYKQKDTMKYATYLPALPAIEETEDYGQPPPVSGELSSDEESDTSISSSPPRSSRATSSMKVPALPAIEEQEDCWRPPPVQRKLGSDDEADTSDTSISSSPPRSSRTISTSRDTRVPNEQETLRSPQDASDINKAIYCNSCEIWLNGPDQWATHLRGQKHRRKNKTFQRRQEQIARLNLLRREERMARMNLLQR